MRINVYDFMQIILILRMVTCCSMECWHLFSCSHIYRKDAHECAFMHLFNILSHSLNSRGCSIFKCLTISWCMPFISKHLGWNFWIPPKLKSGFHHVHYPSTSVTIQIWKPMNCSITENCESYFLFAVLQVLEMQKVKRSFLESLHILLLTKKSWCSYTKNFIIYVHIPLAVRIMVRISCMNILCFHWMGLRRWNGN